MELRTLSDAERYLDSFINLERVAGFDYERLGLERIRALLAALGHPESGLPCVHITGSKGKGTVALAAEALLRAAGRRVGTYTSPHLESWRERFRLDGAPVSARGLVESLRRARPAIERLRADPRLCPSFFDITTALALVLFREARVDAAVVEVGIGGRIDSTNVVEPRVSVLTNVQLEHTDKLGDSLEAIAREKAGILRPAVPLVYGPLEPEALGAVIARAVAEDTPLEEVDVREVRATEKGLSFRLADGRALRSAVLGRHQARNLALAVRAAEHFLERSLTALECAAFEGLVLPARLERIGGAILDSAHTPDSARALRETLEAHWPGRRWVLALSISRDKDAAGIFGALADSVRACVIARAEPTRSRPPEELEAVARASGIATVECSADPAEALARARELLGPAELLVCAGSFYFAGALRRALRGDEPVLR